MRPNSPRIPHFAVATWLALLGAAVAQAVPPTLTKSFAQSVIPVGGVTALTLTVSNADPGPIFDVTFSDTLPAGLLVATPNGLVDACGGATATAGGNSITFNVGTIPISGQCVVTVNIVGTTAGLKTNTTSTVTASLNDESFATGAAATASITVGGGMFLVRYASNLNAGDSMVNLTNTGANGAALNGPGFGGPAGNICLNVYAFSPDEQLVSCCSCLITPNGLASLSVNNDLISNTLTGVRPNSIVIKVVPTGAGAAFTGVSCTNSAALAGNAANPLIPSGALAFGTTIHALGAGFGTIETPFSLATLSPPELASITNRCTNIIGNGSTFGICRSCRAGGLNAAN